MKKTIISVTLPCLEFSEATVKRRLATLKKKGANRQTRKQQAGVGEMV